MALLTLEEYLQYIGMSGWSPGASIECELCGHSGYVVARDSVRVSSEHRASLFVVACRRCGFLRQEPRFDFEFYAGYYESRYKKILAGSGQPPAAYLEDQLARGEHLYHSLSEYFGLPGSLLDVGCSAGGLMMAFAKRGWSVFGTDPDKESVEYGVRTLGLPITATPAELMDLAGRTFDLIIITGSLEHVADTNAVLATCRNAAAKNALLLVEGWGIAQARKAGAFGHNHRRFLMLDSIRRFMLKYGWFPLLLTERELTGPTRPHSVFGLGRLDESIPLCDWNADLASAPVSAADGILKQLDEWAIG